MGSETVGAVKIMSYLEKKGKLKVVTTWKKYWFVLEGRLLLYYRSQEEYENLAPFKGSINMGLATSIRPGLATAGVFQIVTRTNTVTLRAKERSVQEKWLQALLDASGQQTASNPIKMSHFRYSMDDLIPTGAKHQHPQAGLTRQNTLPNRFRNAKVERTQSIVQRIRSIGGQSYGGSLDTINRLSKNKSQPDSLRKMSEKSVNEADSETETEVYQKNDLYGGIIIENTEYISTNGDTDLKSDVDHNKNCYIIENDQYMKSDEVMSVKSDACSSTLSENSKTRVDGVEYYCTYEDINAMKSLIANRTDSNIYHEPFFPVKSEDRKSESDDCACGKDDKKMSKLSKFTRKLKGSGNELQKKSANFIMKLKGKKKNGDATSEPIYDSVDYFEINKIQQEKRIRANSDQLLVKQLIDLQQTLQDKKNKLKEMIDTQSPTTKSETEVEASEENKELKMKTEDRSSCSSTLPPEETSIPPGLPPRRGSKTRSRSPFHDVPKNNSPVLPTNSEQLPDHITKDYSIDKILSDLELESKKTDSKAEELTVRQLIEKFNQVGHDENNSNETEDVSLRQKSDSSCSDDAADLNAILMNRHSDELYKLLEELTKVTSAPLMTPGVTSSLVQMKSQPLTDEEWLAIAPIRRRRHSEPDYDVPRPHRSLQILPRTPDKDDNDEDSVIPATRFFGPVLPPSVVSEKPPADPSMSWRSMTPDSLEPLQLLHAALKKQQRLELNASSDVERDRSIEYEKTIQIENKIIKNGTLDVGGNDLSKIQNVSKILANFSGEMKTIDNYLDSLEPLNEEATAF